LFYERFVAFWGGIPNPIDKFLMTDSLLVRSLILCAMLSGLGALAGIVVLIWRRSDFAFPLAVYPVVFPFLYYITHTSLRYRHPIDPEILLLTAIACGAVFGAWPTGKAPISTKAAEVQA
jgi:hypothetical protein